ncbi:MAG: winged helix DNA-binding protein [Bacteroidales bacterium]|jgi:DNA-binding MarR family transcriptional regulator|nr:winged helix DNA-binding protein [Prevotella sp.]MDR3046936.1 winged helix DNA-binding protein [Bacteroidales bacterium]
MEEICKLKDIYKSLYNFEKEFAEKNGITINEGMVLCCMKDGKPKSANELCGFVGLSNSRVSRIINTVETKGYIIREMGAVDKRQMIFTLTEAGSQKIKEMMKQELNLSELVKELTKITI